MNRLMQFIMWMLLDNSHIMQARYKGAKLPNLKADLVATDDCVAHLKIHFLVGVVIYALQMVSLIWSVWSFVLFQVGHSVHLRIIWNREWKGDRHKKILLGLESQESVVDFFADVLSRGLPALVWKWVGLVSVFVVLIQRF